MNKKHTMMRRFITLLLPVLIFFTVNQIEAKTNADSSVVYRLTDASSMVIEGTSTVHDWEADVKKFDVTLKMMPGALKASTPKAGDFKSVTVDVPVKQIKSGKGGMDSKMYDALKEKKHPQIKFALNDVQNISSSTQDTTFSLDLNGDLTIAGVSRSVSLEVKGQKNSDGTYQFKSSKKINMKDFQMDPPSAMFGAIKSGEEVTIQFDLKMAPENKLTAN